MPCLLTLIAFPATTLTAQAAPPNVLLILTDDQGWWDVGHHGNTDIETPTMDRLATEGVNFDRFYACPVCSPTRASLMTGRCYMRTGANDTYMGRDVMNADEVTVAQVLKKRGYITGAFGKWHLGRYAKYHPMNRGFDNYFGFWQYGFINRYFDSDELFAGMTPVETSGYVTDVLTNQVIDFIKTNRDHPFFCYVPYNACHFPYLVPDPYIVRYLAKGLDLQNARIYGMITNLDENIARLLKTLDALNLTDDTIVIFLSDNGGVSTHFSAGLRGRKASAYEGGVRVPFIARWPDKFPAGRHVALMADVTDIAPTLCDLVGTTMPTDRTIDGRSLAALLRGEDAPPPHAMLYHQWCRVRPDPDKNWAVQDGRYKLVNGQLFDLQEDPGEKQNIAADQPDRVKALRAAFEKWFRDVTDDQDYEVRPPIEVGRTDENPVEIDVTWADPVGDTITPRYDRYYRDRIDHWTNPTDGVRWKIDVINPGRFEVTMSYGCAPDEAASTFRLSAGDTTLQGRVNPTPGPTIFQTFRIGTIDLPSGPTTLELFPITIANHELMHLHKLWLRRLSSGMTITP